MEEYSTKYLVKLGVFSIVLTIISYVVMIISYVVMFGIVTTIEWIQNGGIRELKAKRKEKKEAKKASRYVTKTVESK